MSDRESLGAWGAVIGRLLPGDHIHYEAPRDPSTDAKRATMDAAMLKRMRKEQRRRELAARQR